MSNKDEHAPENEGEENGEDPVDLEAEDNDEQSQPKSYSSFFSSWQLVLENEGAVARDHMANERTFLAWVRTGLVMATLGVAFMQMYSIHARAETAVWNDKTYELDKSSGIKALERVGKPLGILVGVFSIVILLFGFFRYFDVQHMLRKNEFPATRVIALALVVIGVTVMSLVLALDIRSL